MLCARGAPAASIQPFTTTVTTYHHTYRLLIASSTTSPSHISSISNMSKTSSTFQALFNAAFQDYEDKTGISLIDHPLARQLETCNSVHSVMAILQDQAQSFREFRGNDGKLMKSLKSSVDVLCSPSINSTLNEAIGLVVHTKSFIGYLVSDGHSTAIPACQSNISRHQHPTRRMSLPPIMFAYPPDI